MQVELVMRAVDGFILSSGTVDMSAGLSSDGGALALESKDTAFFGFRLVAVPVGHPLEDRFDPARAGEGKGLAVFGRYGNFFVLGTNAPLGSGLGAGLEVANQILFLFNQIAHLFGS